MRYFLFYFITLAFAQSKGQTLYVEYEHSMYLNDPFGAVNLNSVLIAEDSQSYFTIFLKGEMQKKRRDVKEDKNDDMAYHILKTEDFGDSSTLIYNKVHNGISQNFIYNGRPTIIMDTGVVLNWEILNERKDIQNFSCIKALVSFRGRDYIALLPVM